MKRATNEWLSQDFLSFQANDAATEIHVTLARQRAEIRRHRSNMETLRQLTCKCGASALSGVICAPCRYVREALAPKRRARK